MDPEVTAVPGEEVEPVVADPAVEPATEPAAEPAPEPTEDDKLLEALDKSLADFAPKPKVDPEADPKAEPAADPAKGAEPATPEKPAEPAEKKPSDEFGDLPENTKAETRERFTKLKTSYDETFTELETLKQQHNDLTQRAEGFANEIKATGTTPEQFGIMMRYIGMVNSDKVEDARAAFDIIKGEYQALARRLGEDAPGFDLLDDHSDLKKRYDDGELSREDAVELASARNLKKAQQTPTQPAKAEPAPDADQKQQVATRELARVGATIRQLDPHYAAKKDQLIALSTEIIKSEPDPLKWADKIMAGYSKIPNPAPAAPATPKTVVQQPIRPGATNSSGGQVSKRPASAEEAVDLALSQL